MTIFGEIDPPARLLMGPGPVNAHPRVLRAQSAQLLGQFDPEMTSYMNEVMELYRGVFQTKNRWSLLVNGTSRAGIEAALVSLLEPGDRIVVGNFGRFGGLLTEIAERCGAEVHQIVAPWGEVLSLAEIDTALATIKPKVFAVVHGDTSTTIAQPLEGVGALCRKYGVISYVDATATLGGQDLPVDALELDVVTTGLQKCLGGPSGSAPITISDRAAEVIYARKHVEQGLMTGIAGVGRRIASNYFDLAMVMDYWSEKRLNHHTEATSALYGARECARLALEEGLEARFARHDICSRAMQAAVRAMGLELYGNQQHKMRNVTGIVIPAGIDGEAVRTRMREDYSIEIGSSFGPLHGKIWRIGAMGFNANKPCVVGTLAAFENVLRRAGVKLPQGGGVDAALEVFAS